jgi:hypothetical protein
MRLNLVLIFAIKLLLLTTPSHVHCINLFNSLIAAITTFTALSGGAYAQPSSSQASLKSQNSKVGSPHTSFSDCLAEVTPTTHAASFPSGSTFSLPACLNELNEEYSSTITALEATIADLKRDNSACRVNWALEAKGRYAVNKSLQKTKRSNQRCKEKRAKCLNYMKYHKQNKHGKGRKGIG